MDDLDYFVCKPGRSRIANKRCKFGAVKRSSATLRRNNHVRRSQRIEATIVKHISTCNQWKVKDVEDNFDIDDGRMVRFSSHTQVPSQRGKGVFSPIAGWVDWTSNDCNVTYSMNKKKRWLLPEMLKDEINEDTCEETNPCLQDIDLTVIEREICFTDEKLLTKHIPDTVGVTTTVKSLDEDHPLPKARKLKRKKYGWSTDMMGLSQKRKGNDNNENPCQNLKPQVTYEIRRPRSPARYPNFQSREYSRHCLSHALHRKVHKGSKHEQQYLDEESEENFRTSATTAHEINEDCETEDAVGVKNSSHAVQFRLSDSLETWRPSKHKKRMSGHSKSTTIKPYSMKDRVVFTNVNQDTVVSHNNKLNISESAVADAYWERIAKNEEEDSMKVEVTVRSLLALESHFVEPLGKETQPKKIHGVDAIRGKSRPVKYAFQMKDQLISKSPTGEVHPATCYLTLESMSDRQQCMNKENCYFNEKFCVCCDYLPMRLKTIALSKEKSHQANLKLWNAELKKILQRERPNAKGTYLEKIIKIAANLLKNASQMQFDENGEISKQHITPAPKLSPYVRRVTDNVSALLGFSTSQITETAFSTILNAERSENGWEENHLVITNKVPFDFCEICYASLSDKNEACLASAMVSCNHWFCTECWRRHVSAMARHVTGSPIQCPGYACNVVIDDVTLMTLLPGDVVATYRNRQMASAVKRSEEYQHCPRCSNLVKRNLSNTSKAESKIASLSCICGARWCAGCKGEPHWPATCKSAALYWEELKTKMMANRLQLLTSVSGRKCPECHEAIEKDGGCQMMTCVCGITFCWKCMKTFDECGYRCKTKEDDLETFELESGSMKFGRGVREAILFADRYQAFKQHKLRVGLCRSTVSKWIASQHPNVTMTEFVDLSSKAETRFEDALLFCDSIYHVMQYLAICIATQQSRNKDHFPNLETILKQLKYIMANIENCLFTWNPHIAHKVSPEQRVQKQFQAARNLIKIIRTFVNRNCDM